MKFQISVEKKLFISPFPTDLQSPLVLCRLFEPDRFSLSAPHHLFGVKFAGTLVFCWKRQILLVGHQSLDIKTPERSLCLPQGTQQIFINYFQHSDLRLRNRVPSFTVEQAAIQQHSLPHLKTNFKFIPPRGISSSMAIISDTLSYLLAFLPSTVF